MEQVFSESRTFMRDTDHARFVKPVGYDGGVQGSAPLRRENASRQPKSRVRGEMPAGLSGEG